MDNNTTYYNQDALRILQDIYQHCGSSVFESGDKVLRLFTERAFAQHLQRETDLLKVLSDCGSLRAIGQATSLGSDTQRELLYSVRKDLVSNKNMDDAFVIGFLQLLSDALHWNYRTFQADCARTASSTQSSPTAVSPDWKNKALQPDASFKNSDFGPDKEKQPPRQEPPVKKKAEQRPVPPPQPVKKKAEPDPSPKKETAKKPHSPLPILLLVLLVLAAFAALLLLPRLTKKESTSAPAALVEAASSTVSSEVAQADETNASIVMPDVVGLDEDAARVILSKAGLTIKVRYQYDANTAGGDVLRQSPAAGTTWNGKIVELVVCDRSLGMVSVPDVVGMQLSAAKEVLEKADFTTGARLSGNETAMVTAQTPAGGTKAEKGSSVTLSYERAAASETTVPQTSIESSSRPASSSSAATSSSSSSASHTQPAQAQTKPAEPSTPPVQETKPAQPAQPVQTVSAYISSCTKNLIQFVTSGGNVTINVEYIYPSGAHSQRFALGTYSDGVHEFSPGVSITDPRGTYQVCLYDSNGNLLATSGFTN